MTDKNSSSPTPNEPAAASWYTLETEAQAQLLLDENKRRYLEPFLARERSISEAADEIGVSLNSMYYRVKKAHAASLLVTTREEARPGRSVRYYRTVADAFFIPFRITPYAALEERIHASMQERSKQISRSMASLLRESGWEGQRLYRDRNGTIWRDSADAPTRQLQQHLAVFDVNADLRLSPAEAQALRDDLYALWERYRHSDHGDPYALNLMILPLRE